MNRKNVLIMVLLLAIAGGQICYFMTIHKQNKRKVEDARLDIQTKEIQLIQLKKQLETLPETKEELLKTEMKITALTNKIPSYMSSAREFSDMIRMMQTSNFAQITIETDEVVQHKYENKLIYECKYVLKYVSPFTQSRNFINSLRQSDQLLDISSFKVSNAPQMDEEKESAYRYLYGEGFNELVTSEVNFCVFVNPESTEEVYDPSTNLLTNTHNAFFNVETLKEKEVKNKGEQGDVVMPKEVVPPATTSQQEGGTKFEISLTDILTSGDTYSFSGPSNVKDSVYAGLVGHEDATIKLHIKEDSYTIFLETADGEKIEKQESLKVYKPHLDIFSTMKKIAPDMPKIQIYLQNDTNQMLTVRLDGTLLENVTLHKEGNITTY